LQYTDVFARFSDFFADAKKKIVGLIAGVKNSENFKFRVAGIVAAGALGVFALALSLSLLGAVFGLRAFNLSLGAFLSHSYGILAFFAPAFLCYAAYILLDSKWRPQRIFALNASLLPFATLGVGFMLMRDFDARAMESAFFASVGRIGFGAIIIFLTFAQALGLQALGVAIFGRKKTMIRRRKWRLRDQGPFLPAPGDLPPREEFSQSRYEDDLASLRAEAGSEASYGAYEDAFAAKEIPLALEYSTDFFRDEKIETGEFVAAQDWGSQDIQDIIEDTIIQDTATAIEEKTQSEFNTSLEDAPVFTYDDSWPSYDELVAKYADDFTEKDELAETAIEEPELEMARAPDAPAQEKVAVSASKTTMARGEGAKPGIKKGKYSVPVEILNQYPDGEYWIIDQATKDASVTLKETLEEFKIQAEVTGIRKGPVVTMFEILPAPGVKLSRIVNLQDNIALRLAASSVRIVAPIPGKHAVGIEVPNVKRNIVSFREIIEGELQREGKRPEIPVVMG